MMRGPVKQLLSKNGIKRHRIRNPPPRLSNMPFASDFMAARLPSVTLGVELVKGACLGFRRHSVDRFIKSLVLYGNDAMERSKLWSSEPFYSHGRDGVLQNYIQRMPLDQLLVLYQLNLKCTVANAEVKYSFVEAVSSRIAKYMEEVTSHGTIGEFLLSSSGPLRTHRRRYNAAMCAFLFQPRKDLLRCREEALNHVDDGRCPEEAFVLFKTVLREHDSSHTTECNRTVSVDTPTKDAADVEGNESTDHAGAMVDIAGKKVDQLDISGEDRNVERPKQEITSSNTKYRDITYNPQKETIPLNTKSEDCFLSTNVMSLVLCHIFTIKFWHKGFPFNIWLNQYFAHNVALYHPVFPMLYVANVVALTEKNSSHTELDRICDTLNGDLLSYSKKGFFNEQRVLIRLAGQVYETRLGPTEMVELFSTVKRLISSNKFQQVYTATVGMLTSIVKNMPADAKLLNSISAVCNRNDGVGGLENLLEVLETKTIENIEFFTLMDVCILLQAMYKNELHSQDLVDTMAVILEKEDLECMSLSTIALAVQTLGRMQATFKSNAFLHKIADFFVSNPGRYIEASESSCSGILWGFYKLHFKNSPFLELALQRYSSKDIGSFNVNSLVISLTALTRFDACNDADTLMEIYKVVLRNIAGITISTAQQLITCITRMQDNITLCCSEKVCYTNLVSLSSKLIHATMKHVCERLMDQLTTVQAGAMLNALYRSRHRTQEIIAPLIASIAGSHRKGQNWHSEVHMPKRSIHVYDALPPCPFDIYTCRRKLEKVEVTHLVGICEAIHGLDYWSPFSLHLMLQIKEQITPQLHDMKATHILSSCISFANWPFRDFQMNTKMETTDGQERLTKDQMIKMLDSVVEHDAMVMKERTCSWFDDEPLEGATTKAERYKNIIMRTYWKEDFFLACIESLHRHSHFLSAASMPLRRMKLLYDMLRLNVYVEDVFISKVRVPVSRNDFCSSQCPFLILEHKPPLKPSMVSNVMPQNLVNFQAELYEISRTESFYNFLFVDATGTNGSIANTEEEEESQIEQLDSMESLPGGKEVPKIRPLYTTIEGEESQWNLESSSYHVHQGSGAIFQVKDNFIYVDPVIGGFRTTLLLLKPGCHYIPHLVEGIYNIV